MSFVLSENSKNNIKRQFEKLHGIYTKTLKNNEVVSYMARCDCPDNNDYVVLVHYQCKNFKNDKYLAMANCIVKGQRYLKKIKNQNLKIENKQEIICQNKFSEYFNKNIQPKIYQYQRNFIDRIKKYYKSDKKVLIFYL